MTWIDRRLREEDGQSIVLFVVTTTALMGLLALVLNVGHFIQSQRHLQTAADAAVLAAAQSDFDTVGEFGGEAPVAALNMAHENWSGTVVAPFCPAAGAQHDCQRYPDKVRLTIKLVAQHEVGYLAQSVIAFLGLDLTSELFKARAEAVVDSPIGLDQVAPIAIRCGTDPIFPSCEKPWPGWEAGLAGAREWPLDPDDTSPTSPDAVSFEYKPDPANQDDTFMPLSASPGATLLDVTSILQTCNPELATEICGMDVSTTPTTLDVLPPNPGLTPTQIADELRAALRDIGPWPHLVPVYDNNPDFEVSGSVNVIGFAALSFTVDDPSGGGGPVVITGTFHKMFFDAATLDADGTVKSGGGQYDFGVRSIALSG
jgi:hypothetical protein